jgi:hypothetical protein
MFRNTHLLRSQCTSARLAQCKHSQEGSPRGSRCRKARSGPSWQTSPRGHLGQRSSIGTGGGVSGCKPDPPDKGDAEIQVPEEFSGILAWCPQGNTLYIYVPRDPPSGRPAPLIGRTSRSVTTLEQLPKCSSGAGGRGSCGPLP